MRLGVSRTQKLADIMLNSELKDLLERIERVLTSHWVTLEVANMIICCQHYLYDVLVHCGYKR
jgi:hypothetical protein